MLSLESMAELELEPASFLKTRPPPLSYPIFASPQERGVVIMSLAQTEAYLRANCQRLFLRQQTNATCCTPLIIRVKQMQGLVGTNIKLHFLPGTLAALQKLINERKLTMNFLPFPNSIWFLETYWFQLTWTVCLASCTPEFESS